MEFYKLNDLFAYFISEYSESEYILTDGILSYIGHNLYDAKEIEMNQTNQSIIISKKLNQSINGVRFEKIYMFKIQKIDLYFKLIQFKAKDIVDLYRKQNMLKENHIYCDNVDELCGFDLF